MGTDITRGDKRSKASQSTKFQKIQKQEGNKIENSWGKVAARCFHEDKAEGDDANDRDLGSDLVV